MKREQGILSMMEIFGRIDSSIRQIKSPKEIEEWHPKNGVEQEAFRYLIAAENREALKHWYAQGSTINPVAEMFRQILERAVGEELPLKN